MIRSTCLVVIAFTMHCQSYAQISGTLNLGDLTETPQKQLTPAPDGTVITGNQGTLNLGDLSNTTENADGKVIGNSGVLNLGITDNAAEVNYATMTLSPQEWQAARLKLLADRKYSSPQINTPNSSSTIQKGDKKVTNPVYRRSSLYTIMLDSKSPYYNDVIKQTFCHTPIPDKYNEHVVGQKIMDISPALQASGKNAPLDNEKYIAACLMSNGIAKEMVAKWFNRKPDGSFDMDLVANRGQYNATEMDVNLALKSIRGMNMLKDAGEELIANSFVVVNEVKYVNKEEVASKVSAGLQIAGTIASYAGYDNLANLAQLTSAGVTVAGKGYVVKTTSYLYQLDWNENIANTFYTDYWVDANNPDPAKKYAFDNSDLFKLKFIGWETSWADLQSTIFTTKTEPELVEIATVRAVHSVIGKLQKKYDVFKTKTPLLSTDPALTAKIGMKEGVEKGDKFEVLEQVIDNNGRTRYRRKGIIKVDGSQIWDNRYFSSNTGSHDYTVFKSPGLGLDRGMLIRQIK